MFSGVSLGSAPTAEEIKQISIYELPEEVADEYETNFENDASPRALEAVDELQVVLIVDYSGSNLVKDYNPIDPSKMQGMLKIKAEDLPARMQESVKAEIQGDYWRRWDSVFLIAKNMFDAMKSIDDDGEIPVYFFGNKVHKEVVSSKFKLLRAFKNKDHNPVNVEQTDLLLGLKTAIDDHQDAINAGNKILFVVLTDGEPGTSRLGNTAQERAVQDLIETEISSKDPSGDRLNVFFVRVGDDNGAIKFLERMDELGEGTTGPSVGKNVDTKSDNYVHKFGPKVALSNAISEDYDRDPKYAITEDLK